MSLNLDKTIDHQDTSLVKLAIQRLKGLLEAEMRVAKSWFRKWIHKADKASHRSATTQHSQS